MALLALTTLSLLFALPQAEPDPRLKTTLSKSDLAGLNKKARTWIAAHRSNDDRSTSKSRKKMASAKSKFLKSFDSKSKKVSLLGSVGDMLRIFENTFAYKRITTSGELKMHSTSPKYGLLAPKRYDAHLPYRTIVVLPGRDGEKGWAKPKEYLDSTWKGTESVADSIMLVPILSDADYDVKAELSSQDGEAAESSKIGGVLMPCGEVRRTFHMDRRKMFLDCGAGNCGFGLRLVTYFPDYFAGLILREPVLAKGLALDSLVRIPILLVSSEETKDVCDKIQETLDALAPGFVTIVAGEGEAPYSSAAGEIDKWIRGKSRQLFPAEVLITPNHDKFKSNHWVEIISCEPLESVGPSERPFVKVKADPEKNRIIITTRNVSAMGLYLNDCFVDLDKELVLVVNGKELGPTKLPRSMTTLRRYMLRRFDPTFLCTAYYRFEVPREPK